MMKYKILLVLAFLLSELSTNTYSKAIVEKSVKQEVSINSQLNENQEDDFPYNYNYIFFGIIGLIGIIMIGVIIKFTYLKKNLENTYRKKTLDLKLSHLENELGKKR